VCWRAVFLPIEGEILQDVLLLGVAVLVFTAGIELNPNRVGRQRRLALQVGVTQFLLLGLWASVVGRLLGLGA
jgi:Kef-type K+ transport system membrane component KefB